VPLVEKSSVGNRIRELRRKQNISAKSLACETGFSAAAISKFERGLLRPTEEFVEKSISALKLHGKEALALRELAALFNSQFRRWSSHSHEIKQNQKLIAAREKNASNIWSYWNQIVPGLLQSDSYMRALLPGFTDAKGNSFESIVKARKKRQRLLKRKGRTFRFVLSEACLRNCVSSSAVMSEQLAHLKSIISSYPSVELRILPFSHVLKRIPLHHFVLYDERTVEIEVSKGQIDIWLEEDVKYFVDLMNQLGADSLPPARSVEIIDSIAKLYH